MTSKLGQKLAGQVQAAPAKTRLGAVLEQGPRGELRDVPGFGPVFLRLIGSEAVDDIEEAVTKRMKERGFEPDALHSIVYDSNRARHTLAIAARDPEARDKPFGTLEEWHQIDPDTVSRVWSEYIDVRMRLSPLDVPMTPELRAMIIGAISKKNAMLLRAFDVCTLSSFLLTLDFPPANSPTTTSSNGDSPSES